VIDFSKSQGHVTMVYKKFRCDDPRVDNIMYAVSPKLNWERSHMELAIYILHLPDDIKSIITDDIFILDSWYVIDENIKLSCTSIASAMTTTPPNIEQIYKECDIIIKLSNLMWHIKLYDDSSKMRSWRDIKYEYANHINRIIDTIVLCLSPLSCATVDLLSVFLKWEIFLQDYDGIMVYLMKELPIISYNVTISWDDQNQITIGGKSYVLKNV
jgi:hypothetical protein